MVLGVAFIPDSLVPEHQAALLKPGRPSAAGSTALECTPRHNDPFILSLYDLMREFPQENIPHIRGNQMHLQQGAYAACIRRERHIDQVTAND